ncbi:hypothetical protein LCGC14_1879330 [marine sediment metagenome]|uniref:Gene product 88 domain-containing protein n=1 Tax=marine sediment metagenome TaxID=412755 RepID=A0A0F9G2P8_9ZZZZ
MSEPVDVEELTYHVIDDRRATRSAYALGNSKIGLGAGVYSYSKLPGRPDGAFEQLAVEHGLPAGASVGTCPGSTVECESFCYSKRIKDNGPVWDWMKENTERGDVVPPVPKDARLVRIHISGDFDTEKYILSWTARIAQRPDVEFFAYTRSWRVPELLPHLEGLRSLPNIQLFASVDLSMTELPPEGWRRAWIETDPRAALTPNEVRLEAQGEEPLGKDREDWRRKEAKPLMPIINERGQHVFTATGGVPSYVCPEETGRKPNCDSCGYCIRGKKNDVLFLLH